MSPKKIQNQVVIKAFLFILNIYLIAIARGPDECSLMFNLTLRPGKHLSDFADEEKWFSKSYGFYAWKYDNTGNIDTIDLKYKYLDFALDVNASWYLTEMLAFGINYRIGNINQCNKPEKGENSASFIELHRISFITSLWPMF